MLLLSVAVGVRLPKALGAAQVPSRGLVASLAFFVLRATVARWWWLAYLSEICLLVAVVLFFVNLARNRRHVP
jgi:hypothetical protein